MSYVARVKVNADNRTSRIEAIGACGNGALEGTSPRARSIKRGDGTIRGAHEAVKYVARVKVISGNRTCGIDVKGEGALDGACARARSIERGEGAVGSAHIAVS